MNFPTTSHVDGKLFLSQMAENRNQQALDLVLEQMWLFLSDSKWATCACVCLPACLCIPVYLSVSLCILSVCGEGLDVTAKILSNVYTNCSTIITHRININVLIVWLNPLFLCNNGSRTLQQDGLGQHLGLILAFKATYCKLYSRLIFTTCHPGQIIQAN